MFHYQRRRELTFHHNRVVALFIKRRQHGLNREVFRQRIKASDDNSDHFIALSSHRAGGAGRRETVLIHHASTRSRVRSLTPLSLLSTRETVDFPTPLRRAMSLIVSRFCILFSRGVTLMVIKRVTLLKRRAMGKVWFIVGLIT